METNDVIVCIMHRLLHFLSKCMSCESRHSSSAAEFRPPPSGFLRCSTGLRFTVRLANCALFQIKLPVWKPPIKVHSIWVYCCLVMSTTGPKKTSQIGMKEWSYGWILSSVDCISSGHVRCLYRLKLELMLSGWSFFIQLCRLRTGCEIHVQV